MATGQMAETLEASADGAKDGGGGGRTGAEGIGEGGLCVVGIEAVFAEAREVTGAPVAIIAETVKGKGVSFMENQVGWHGKAPNDEQFEQAMAELAAAGEEL